MDQDKLETHWWVCELDEDDMPIFEGADGPHSDLEDCKRTIGIMERLNCIGDRVW